MGAVDRLLCPFYVAVQERVNIAAIFRRACWQGCPWLASGNLACEEFPILIWKVPDTAKVILSTSGTKHLLPSEILGFWHLPVRECLHNYPLIKALDSKSQMGFLWKDLHLWPCIFTVRGGSTPGVSPPGLAGTVSKAY